MFNDGMLVGMGYERVHLHVAVHLRRDGEVGDVDVRHGEECHVSEDAAGSPVVVVVKVATNVLCDDT